MKNLSHLKRILRHIRNTYGDIPLQQIEMLIELSEVKRPISHPELEKILGLSHATISRNGKLLGTYRDPKTGKAGGAGLIAVNPDFYERRRLASELTDKGQAFLKEISKMLEEVCK